MQTATVEGIEVKPGQHFFADTRPTDQGFPVFRTWYDVQYHQVLLAYRPTKTAAKQLRIRLMNAAHDLLWGGVA